LQRWQSPQEWALCWYHWHQSNAVESNSLNLL
jgi:hypothetical protein